MKHIIEQRYPEIEVLLCVESGSRAWGFASPDSDYDVRFIYRYRDPTEYLKLSKPEQVILFDIEETNTEFHGWDIKKALELAMVSNVSLYEWANSPLQYHEAPRWRELPFCLNRMANHYRGMAKKTLIEHLHKGDVSAKKYLYCLRPLMCIDYMRRYRKPPPVSFTKLVDKLPHLPVFREQVDNLLDFKMKSVEASPPPKELHEFFFSYCDAKINLVTHEFINKKFTAQEYDPEVYNQFYLRLMKG